MKKQLLPILFCGVITIGAKAQDVTIPDANFKASLVSNSSINTNNDTEIQVSEASAFTGMINVYNKSITNLTGIEAFTKMTSLVCEKNKLTTLDLSANIALTHLNCAHNSLTQLDLSANPDLVNVRCVVNALTTIDISKNTLLVDISCEYNSLTVLDVSNNTELTRITCLNNSITSLDVSMCTKLTLLRCENNALASLNLANGNNTNVPTSNSFQASGNPDLTCIAVDDVGYSTANWTYIDATAFFSTNCGYVGLSDQDLARSLKVYPNPVKDILKIDSKLLVEKIEITNVIGSKFIGNELANQINISALTPGIYLVHVFTAKGIITKVITKRS